jgi:DNA-binding MarR family transcriptional regulator
MSKQALNYLLGQLEETGYLQRVDDPDDRRSKRIRVTKRGWAAGEVMRAAVGEVEQEFVDAHGKKELANLLELLTHLNAVLGTRPAPGQ